MSIIDDIKQEIKALENKLKDIQEHCSHPIREEKWRQITDEYGMEEGGYTMYHCQLCDKHWTVDDKDKLNVKTTYDKMPYISG